MMRWLVSLKRRRQMNLRREVVEMSKKTTTNIVLNMSLRTLIQRFKMLGYCRNMLRFRQVLMRWATVLRVSRKSYLLRKFLSLDQLIGKSQLSSSSIPLCKTSTWVSPEKTSN
jgi:hypothetical protein